VSGAKNFALGAPMTTGTAPAIKLWKNFSVT
jgi:hypothetical protein